MEAKKLACRMYACGAIAITKIIGEPEHGGNESG